MQQHRRGLFFSLTPPGRQHRPRAHRITRKTAAAGIVLLLMLLFSVTVQAGAPVAILSATKSAAFLLDANSNGKADPGDKIRYTVKIDNTSGSVINNLRFTDTVDSNTMLVPNSFKSTPVAAFDIYNSIGNVGLTVPAANGVLANDTDPDGGTISVTAAAGTTAQGGAYSIGADGAFSYLSPSGFEGFDTFSYTITDADSNTDTAVVTIYVNEVIWFIDTSLPSNGNGTLSSPFNTLAALGPAADDAGDIIFLYSSTTAYTGGVTLKADQLLIGQGATGSIASIAGINMALYPHSNALPTTTGTVATRPTLTNSAGNAITLNANNEIHGVTVGDTTGVGIYAGVWADTLKIRDTNITGTGAGINLTAGATMDIELDGLQTSSAFAQGIYLQSVSGSFSLTGANNTIDDALGYGAVYVVGSWGDEPVITITLKSVSSTSASDGIRLYATAPTSSFTVTGDGSTAGSGGTISNSSSNALYVQYTQNISLNWMTIQNTTSDGIWAEQVDGLTLANVTMTNNGSSGANSIYLYNSLGEIAITNSTISTSGLYGIRLHQDVNSLDKLTISGTTIDGAPQFGFAAVVTGANNAAFKITGSSTIKNTGTAVAIQNNGSGTVTTVVENSTFQSNIGGVNVGLNGTGVHDFSINANTFAGQISTSINAGTDSGTTTASRLNGFITNNTVGNATAGSGSASFLPAISIVQRGAARVIASVSGNTTQNTSHRAIAIDTGLTNVATAGADVTLNNNTATNSVYGLEVSTSNQNVLCANITNNKITHAGAWFDYYLSQGGSSVFQLQGYATSVPVTLAANNNTKADLTAATVYGFGAFVAPGAACATPTAVSIASTTTGSAVAAAPHAGADRLAALWGAKPLFSPAAAPARIGAQAVSDIDVTIPRFDHNQSVTFTFDVEVKDPLTGSPTQICNQGSVMGDGTAVFQTDDPETVGVYDATCTPVGAGTPTTGTITVIKTVVGGAPGSDWSFSGTAPIGAFTLPAAGGNQTFSSLTPGSFTISETDKGGWVVSSSCTTGGETGDDSITLDLSAGEAAECTFTNTQCQPGTYDNGSACTPAPAGSFVDTAGATQPTQCPAGRWQDQLGQTSCKLADPGYYVPGPGATEQIVCPAGTTSEAGATECSALPPISFCPVDHPDVAALRTGLLGVGMGSPTRGARNAKLGIPNWQDVEFMQAQLSGVEIGQMKWVRFSVKGQPSVQVNAPTSPAVDPATVKWWDSGQLPTSPWIKGAFFWGPKGNRSPRAFVVWPTYRTDGDHANVLELFDDSSTNYVYHGVMPVQTQTLSIPPTQSAGAEVTVHVALVDVNKDKRPVILTVDVGGSSVQRVITIPNRKNSLNVETFVFSGVPAEVDEVTITLESPDVGGNYPFGGDSAAMIGAAANYPCAMPDQPPTAQPDTYTFPNNVNQIRNSSAGLLADNGSGPDFPGVPGGAIVSFGGGSLGGSVTTNTVGAAVSFAGGQLTVNADGSWSLTNPSFTPGPHTFQYRLQNASGPSDATVTFNIQELCLLNDLNESADC